MLKGKSHSNCSGAFGKKLGSTTGLQNRMLKNTHLLSELLKIGHKTSVVTVLSKSLMHRNIWKHIEDVSLIHLFKLSLTKPQCKIQINHVPPTTRRMLYSGHCSVAFGVFKICIFSEAGLKQKQILFKNKAIDLFIYDNLNVIPIVMRSILYTEIP